MKTFHSAGDVSFGLPLTQSDNCREVIGMAGLADSHDGSEDVPHVLSPLRVGLVVGYGDRVRYVNEAFCWLTGYSADELLAPGALSDLVAPDTRDWLFSRARRRVFGESEPLHYETELVHRDGHRVAVEVSVDVLEMEGGREIVAIFRDLTASRRVESELSIRGRQEAAVVEIARRALVASNVSDLMAVAVDLVARTLDVEFAKVLQLMPDGESLLLRAGVGWKDGYVGRATVGTGLDSQAGYTLAAGAPVVVEDLARETRFRGPPLLVEHGVVSGMSVIIGASPAWGVFGTHTTKRRLFSADDTRFLQTVAHVLAEAIERAEVDEALRAAHNQERRLRQRLEMYARHAVKAQEVERRHIAGELHDELGQILTGLMLTLENVERLPAEVARTRLDLARGLVKDLLLRVHDLSLDLRPAVLDDLGLVPALLWLVERFSAQTGVVVTFAHSGWGGRLEPDVETAAYRIAQEALTNIARHARTGGATLSCVLGSGVLIVEVADQGVGFDPASVGAGLGSGLVGMEERARATGGRLAVESQAGGGTRIIAELAVAAEPSQDV